MSTVRTNNVQVGQSLTATNNFTLYQPASPDGTVRLGVGNTGATTLDAVTVNSSGNVGIGTSSPAAPLDVVTNSSASGIAVRGRSDNISNVAFQSNNGATTYGQLQGRSTDLRIQGVGLPITFFGTGAEVGRFDTSSGNFQFNSGYGSVATAYGCRAWVNFNGTGTVAITASGNVSSITDNGVGTYALNFTNAMPNANYAVIGTSQYASGFDNWVQDNGRSTSLASIAVVRQGATIDSASISVAIFR